MTYVIGRGSYRREVYPTPRFSSAAGGGTITGYDQIISTGGSSNLPLAANWAQASRDGNPANPIQVVLNDIASGDTVEVDWAISGSSEGADDLFFQMMAIVSFVPGVPTYPGDFFFVFNTSGSANASSVEVGNRFSCSAIGAFVVPDGGPFKLTFQLIYKHDNALGVNVGGNNNPPDGTGLNLRVSRVLSTSVAQAPSGDVSDPVIP